MDNKETDLNGLLEDALDDLLDQKEPAPEQQTEVVTGGGVDDVGRDHVIPTSSKSKSKKSKKKEFDAIDEDEMNKFFENMTAQLKAELPKIDPEEAKAKINESVPQIFDLMQNLLSKELLYPALTDLSPRFEEWLKNKESTLNKSDRERYEKQKAIIDEIIQVFDDESLGNQERFERNLDLMETMQSLGSPPEELTVPQEIGKCSIM